MLLSLGCLWPDSAVVRLLSDRWQLDRELSQAKTHGYYEKLVHHGDEDSDDTQDEHLGRILPPPGWTPFVASGLIREYPEYLRWRLKPGLARVWNGEPFHTNALGYRSPDIALPKPAGTFRILVFGSSNTMGHGVGDNETYARHLQMSLNQSPRRDSPVEVVNLAISGDSPTRRLERLKQDAGRLEADWILMDASALDISLERVHLMNVVRRRLPVPEPFVRKTLAAARIQPDDDPAQTERKLFEHFESLTREAYQGYAQESHRLGVPLTLVVLPRADQKLESPRLFKLILEAATSAELDVVDLSKAFADLELESFRISAWDRHPSPEGHRRIAEALHGPISRRIGASEP